MTDDDRVDLNAARYRRALGQEIQDRRTAIGEQTTDDLSPVITATIGVILDHLAHLEFRMGQVLDRLDLWDDDTPATWAPGSAGPEK